MSGTIGSGAEGAQPASTKAEIETTEANFKIFLVVTFFS
jgi:hypothetical protein